MKRVKMIGTVLKWGNSYGIRISKTDMERLNLKEKQQVDIIDIKPVKNPLLELWGTSKDKFTKDDLKKMREGMIESKWLDEDVLS